MSTMESVKAQIRTLIDNANAVTGNTDTDLTTAIGSLIEKANSGGGSSDLVKYVTFMSWDGSTELFKMPVLSGDDCKDPITHGDITSPTRESDVQYHYTYSGWCTYKGGSADTSALKKVTADKTVYASYTTSPVYYTVSFFDGNTLVKTEEIAYGESSSYIYTKDGYTFVSWNPTPTNITGDLSCYANMTVAIEHSWQSMGSTPYNMYYSAMCVYDGKLFTFGHNNRTGGNTQKAQYWTETDKKWVSITSMNEHLQVGRGKAVVYNDEIHLLGTKSINENGEPEDGHIKWDGSVWSYVSDLPYTSSDARPIVHDGKIHLIGYSYGYTQSKYHYVWDGNAWSESTTLPYDTMGSQCVVFNNELHVFSLGNDRKLQYKWNGSDWELVATNDAMFIGSQDFLVVLEGKIHLFKNDATHYRLDGTTWTQLDSATQQYLTTGTVYNGRYYTTGKLNDSYLYRW